MPEFNLNRFRYNWKGDWATGTSYIRDDIVRLNGRTYVCLVTHTASPSFNTDITATLPGSNPAIPQPKWVVMTASTSFIGTWSAGTEYQLGDVVLKDGSLWKCIDYVPTSVDWASDEDHWELYAAHIDYVGDWTTVTDYGTGAIVKYNGIVYKCVVSHVSSGSLLEDDIDSWEIFLNGIEYKGIWSPTTEYRLNDLVQYGSTIYKCTETHQSGLVSLDPTKFTVEFAGSEFESSWDRTNRYQPGDVVKYAGNVYYCIAENFDTQPDANLAHQQPLGQGDSTLSWIPLAYGINFKGTWQQGNSYKPGDVVHRGGDLYKALIPIGLEGQDESSIDYLDPTIWEKLIPGQAWSKSDGYVIYNVTVERNIADTQNNYFFDGGLEKPILNFKAGNTYVFKQDDPSNVYFGGGGGGQGAFNPHPINFSDDNINGALAGGNTYLEGVKYFLNGSEVTKADYEGGYNLAWSRRVQITITENTPTTLYYWCKNHLNMGNQINVDTTGEAGSGSWVSGKEYAVGDIIYWFGSAYQCNFQHIADSSNYPGDNGSGYEYWDLLIQAGQLGGLSDKGDLLTYNVPKQSTLKGDGSTLDVAPVPIGTTDQLLSIDGDDTVFWRNYINAAEVVYVGQHGVDADGYGTKIHKPFASVKYAAEYVERTFTPLTPVKIAVATGRYEEICPISVPAGCVVMGDELRSTTIVANSPIADYKSTGDVFYTKEYLDHFTTFVFDLVNNNPVNKQAGNTAEQVTNLEPAGLGVAPEISNLITNLKNFLEYSLEGGANNPTLTSVNTITTEENRLNGAAILIANLDFIKAELVAYMANNNPTYSFERSRVEMDIEYFIRGIEYDLKYPGNYKTVTSGKRYVNAALGSQLADMFLVRDVTGIRNCTVAGLQGTLNPPGVFDLYRRPTGGAYVALDPGWGPNDNRTWINTRSPYIQGVTTIGTSCVGKKVDGSLHNGGNKSMVSNDFTQVLSDGIGAWVLNNGRAELVSVFTYYCQVGYLASAGGIIRATNGNNSYGTYGSIADGIDATETPAEASVNNRNQQAVVSNVFAGEFSDEIFAFEYNNAGQNYTQASASILGSGTSASVEFDDFRDNGMFEARLLSPEDSGTIGGAGFRQIVGNAQDPTGVPNYDSSYEIKLDVTDGGSNTDYLGMRIIITGGDGTGQYGYVQSYNATSKIMTVYKESTGSQGWDHIVPGTPLATFTTSTQYRIEPRLTVNHPGFTATAGSLAAAIDTKHTAYGSTTLSFTEVEGQLGTGDVVDLDGLEPTVATFDIEKVGPTYNVTLNNAGLGYAAGDVITIAGTSIGGDSPANDLTINVRTTTEDSSNSIVTFTSSGTPKDGKYVVIGDTASRYSYDGDSWDTTTLPGSSDYKRIAAGNNRFVAIRTGQASGAYSLDGETWTAADLGAGSLDWIDVTYGGGKFVAIAENTNTVSYSTDGENWTTTTIPDDLVGDSTATQWQRVSYGKGKFVIIAGSERYTATSTDGITWTRNSNALPAGDFDWVSLAYGNNRFVALDSNGNTAYSLDGSSWTEVTGVTPVLPTEDGSTAMRWHDMKYGQGVFLAVSTVGGGLDAPTTLAASSEDGIVWTARSTLIDKVWRSIVFGNPENSPLWLAVGLSDGTALSKIVTGARAKVRADVTSGGSFNQIKIWDPGSGYTDSNPPVLTLVDNYYTTEPQIQTRTAPGVLSQPSFIGRGNGYRTSTTQVTISGDGFADFYTVGNFITLDGIVNVPGPGVQLYITGILDETTDDPDDLKRFVASSITDLGEDTSGTGTRKVRFRVSPSIKNNKNLLHNTVVQLRERYSQCRISGHDFLDIGTGNFVNTNYPDLYAGGAYFIAAPENEVLEQNGGRVFYTSTDQDGNFRTGELFAVNQATGIVTISADFFDLDGLSELALGGVRLGGSGAVVREFSTDPTFAEDSNNVVPTQRAIATFLANRLSVGGSDLETNQLQAGAIIVGGADNVIDTATGVEIIVPVVAVFEGADAALDGSIIGQMMITRNPHDESMQ